MEYGDNVSDEEFQIKVQRFTLISEEVKVLNDEINKAISLAIEGEDPQLTISLDDPKLDIESYKQIVTKVYATIRFKLYQRIKQKTLK